MDKGKKWKITAFILLGAGVLICLIAFAAAGFDFKRLSTVRYITNTYDTEGRFQNIRIDADIENISFVPSDNGECRVVCYEEEKNPHKVQIIDDTLSIERADKKWKQNFGIIMDSPEITVFLPKNHYGELSVDGDNGNFSIPGDFSFDSIHLAFHTGNVSCKASSSGSITISTDTGHIVASDLSASSMILESDTGRINISGVELTEDIRITENTGNVIMENVSCRNFTSDGDTGHLTMTSVVASGQFNIERDTGDIEFNGCDADAIYVKTDTGSVMGTLLTDKEFVTDTDTGSVDVPKSVIGGRCEISTDTGNIRVKISRE